MCRLKVFVLKSVLRYQWNRLTSASENSMAKYGIYSNNLSEHPELDCKTGRTVLNRARLHCCLDNILARPCPCGMLYGIVYLNRVKGQITYPSADSIDKIDKDR